MQAGDDQCCGKEGKLDDHVLAYNKVAGEYLEKHKEAHNHQNENEVNAMGIWSPESC